MVFPKINTIRSRRGGSAPTPLLLRRLEANRASVALVLAGDGRDVIVQVPTKVFSMSVVQSLFSRCPVKH